MVLVPRSLPIQLSVACSGQETESARDRTLGKGLEIRLTLGLIVTKPSVLLKGKVQWRVVKGHRISY